MKPQVNKPALTLTSLSTKIVTPQESGTPVLLSAEAYPKITSEDMKFQLIRPPKPAQFVFLDNTVQPPMKLEDPPLTPDTRTAHPQESDSEEWVDNPLKKIKRKAKMCVHFLEKREKTKEEFERPMRESLRPFFRVVRPSAYDYKRIVFLETDSQKIQEKLLVDPRLFCPLKQKSEEAPIQKVEPASVLLPIVKPVPGTFLPQKQEPCKTDVSQKSENALFSFQTGQPITLQFETYAKVIPVEKSQPKKAHKIAKLKPTLHRKKVNYMPLERKGCMCKRTKCLKLYCDCFRTGDMCLPDCGCSDCYNNEKYQNFRQYIMSETLQNNPKAFGPRFKTVETGDGGKVLTRGCNCRSSGCSKHYCDCFYNGLGCSNMCKCTDCTNNKQTLPNINPADFENKVIRRKRRRDLFGNIYLLRLLGGDSDANEIAKIFPPF